jgi:hypothetical protein
MDEIPIRIRGELPRIWTDHHAWHTPKCGVAVSDLEGKDQAPGGSLCNSSSLAAAAQRDPPTPGFIAAFLSDRKTKHNGEGEREGGRGRGGEGERERESASLF